MKKFYYFHKISSKNINLIYTTKKYIFQIENAVLTKKS